MSKRRSRAIGTVAILVGGLALLAGSGLAAAAAAPSNSRLPQIHGTVQVGQTLAATEGRWKGTQPITFAYQWQRCNSSGGSCANILSSPSGSASYMVTQADVGSRLI